MFRFKGMDYRAVSEIARYFTREVERKTDMRKMAEFVDRKVKSLALAGNLDTFPYFLDPIPICSCTVPIPLSFLSRPAVREKAGHVFQCNAWLTCEVFTPRCFTHLFLDLEPPGTENNSFKSLFGMRQR
jgi:hypothetical protein